MRLTLRMQLGTVNLLAVEEYDDVETRYDFLINQQKDLVDSIAEIRVGSCPMR